MIVKPTADSVLASAGLASAGLATAKGPPPLHLWNPPFCGDIDMRIARDGTWFYLGTPIGRPGLVKLFSSIIKREGDAYFLVTPVEKVGITVDDAPFLAIDVEKEGSGHNQRVTFTTQVGDTAVAGPAHPLRVIRDATTGEPSPYILIRTNLEALIDRKSFYRLIDMCQHQRHEDADWFGLWSDGAFFPIILSADLT